MSPAETFTAYCDNRAQRLSGYEDQKKDLEDELAIYCDQWDKFISEGGDPQSAEGIALNTVKTLVEAELKAICALIE